jgi:3-oxoacyl-[acyl-carrier-protein] synthase-3
MQSASGIAIVGVGHHLATNAEDNATICRQLNVTPDWIVEKTGIRCRYLAGPDDTASNFSVSAALQATEMAGVTAADIDLIVCCTFSADYIFPPLSAKIHKDLGVKGGQIFDLQANCAGFVSGLTAASDRMRIDPGIRNALVVGVEFNSRVINRSDVNTVIYHSDGAGAAVLGRVAEHGIIASSFYTDSSNYEAVRLRGGGSMFPLMGRSYDPAIDAMELNGIATWKQAITHLPSTVRAACAKAGADPKSVDFFVFHQANYNLIEYIVRKMGFDMSKTYTNVEKVGNTGAASVAIAMSETVRKGLLKPDDLVVLAAVGAGFNFGASLWRWSLKGGQ